MLTQDEVRRLFDYRDGRLFWRVVKSSNVRVGCEAGAPNGKGYRRMCIDSKRYLTHRVIFLWHHGWLPDEVDHIKGLNNHIENLRPATTAQNQHNATLRSDNTSGVKGVCRDKATGKWRAACRVNGRPQYLGLYLSISEAKAAVRKFREQHHGEFTNHGESKNGS